MHTDTDPPPEVHFEVVVAGSDYQKLLAHFRGRGTSLPTPSKRVSALIDLDPTCGQFTVTRIGKHKLPKALSIKPGSDTYHNLAQVISTEVQQRLRSEQINPLLAKHLQQIIDLCPDVLPTPLHFSPHDLEVTDSPLPISPLGHAQLVISTLATLAPSVLLDIDDTPTLIVPSEAGPYQKDLLKTLQRALERCPPLLIQVSGNLVELHHSILLPPLPEGMEIEFFVHWGSYEELAPSWSDEHIATIKTSRATSQLPLYYRMHVPIQGWYGATLFARLKNGTEAVWLGTPGYRDARFRIAQDDSPSTIDYHQGKRQQASDAYKDLKAALTNPVDSLQFLERFPERHPELSLGGVLAQVISDGQIDEQSTLEGLSLPQHILSRIAPSYGIQELIFASPEGPHAAAGGLAQVISGLPKELARLGIPVSIITPLFRYDNGNKHTAAESVLAHGVAIDSERVLPQYVATVAIPLGPTYHSGTSWAKRQPSTIECKVYLAQKGTIRIFFLTNSSVFDRLYQPVLVDEQLRRAIIFSRAVLETIACEQLMLRPSGIISNDWMTACVPAFAALDPRYAAVPWIRASKTIHMIHNGGADYHGRLPVNYNNEDLWPLFNLSSDHYFGFRDLHNGALLNLTAAASQHVTGGVVTVSQPYAQQLVAPGGGDGLEHILYPKRARVYGVSNGINRSDIDAWLSLRIGLCPLQQRQASHIVEAKERLRGHIQERFGLQVNPEMRLLTFVGRLAEQKGLSLLSGFTGHAHRSTLEDILVSHPETQILIAGPVTHGDREASALCETLHYLAQRYPGRVASALDYVSHSTALELIAASTLFLMPSRFEPGGITQLEALALGTPVVGRSVGGIKATIRNYEPACGTGTGFLCDDYTPTAFANTLHWALNICADKAQYEHIVQQALDAKHSWVDRAPTFAAVVQRLILGEARTRALPILNYQSHLADLATV